METQDDIRMAKFITKIVVGGILGLVALIWVWSFASSAYTRYQVRLDAENAIKVAEYNVQTQELNGKASLEGAKWSTQVATEQARAQLEAEKLNALAEVERAKGAAEAIKIEGGSLTDNYIKYLWVRQLSTGEKQLIYIPTEAGLPILEAGKR